MTCRTRCVIDTALSNNAECCCGQVVKWRRRWTWSLVDVGPLPFPQCWSILGGAVASPIRAYGESGDPIKGDNSSPSLGTFFPGFCFASFAPNYSACNATGKGFRPRRPLLLQQDSFEFLLLKNKKQNPTQPYLRNLGT